VREDALFVDRPTALDLAFLDLETPQAPLHVGWTLRFGGVAHAQGRDVGGTPTVAALRRHLDARLHAVPRFRRRLVRPALGGPFWADDPGFDVAHHVFGVTLAAPGGAAELREVAGALVSQPLPEDRPLWRMYLVDGLAEGEDSGACGFAIVGQAHHALIDGVAAIAVAGLLFGRQDESAAADVWIPSAAPGAGEALRATIGTRARAAGAAAREAAGALWGEAAPDAAASSGDRATTVLRDAARALDGLARPAAPTSLEHSLTPRRAVAHADVSFEAARAAGRRRYATINDMLLAAVAIALRGALRRRGEAPEAVRALVPVSVRAGEDPALGNRISFLGVDLPVGEPDVERVLKLIRARTAAAKTGGDAGLLEALGRSADALPGPGRRLVARSALRAVAFTLVVSNVCGPPMELSLLGRPLLGVHPMVPLLHGHALTIGAVSYGGRLQLGLAADAEVVDDVVTIASDLEAAFEALCQPARTAARPGAVTPWRARAQARRQRAANR
jgi:diacylglycerol O-acyltransferase